MNVLGAMKETLDLAKEKGLDNMDSDIKESDYPHLEGMFERAKNGRFDDGSYGEYSYGKLCRWLGWMQACAVINSMGDITMEDMKQINKRNA